MKLELLAEAELIGWFARQCLNFLLCHVGY